MIDSTIPARRAVLAALKASAPLVALVPAARHYPQAPPADPAWPFLKWGSPSAVPRRAACLDGQEIIGALHGFSKGRYTGNRLVESAEDHAGRIGAAMARAIDGVKLHIPGGYIHVRVAGSQLMQDVAEAGAFHVIVFLRIKASTA